MVYSTLSILGLHDCSKVNGALTCNAIINDKIAYFFLLNKDCRGGVTISVTTFCHKNHIEQQRDCTCVSYYESV